MQKKQKNKKKQKAKNNTQFLGGLENGQEVVPPFLPKKGVFKILKNPYFYSVSRTNGWRPLFFQKGYVARRTHLEGQQMKTFWGLLDRNL